MQKVIRILSGISGALAALSIVANAPALFGGKSWFLRFAMFNMVKSGGAMGFMGNLLGILLMFAGFGAMFWYGWKASKGEDRKAIKSALIAGVAMTVLSLLSLFCSIAGHMFTMGDILILLFPAAYTFCIFSGIKA